MEVKPPQSNFRVGSSRNAGSLDTFARQMADYAIGERFRDLRENHPDRPSRERVAADIGVSTKTLYAWEHSEGETVVGIKWENAKAAGSFFGVDPETLVSREPVHTADWEAPPDPRQEQLDRIERKLDELLRRTERSEPPLGPEIGLLPDDPIPGEPTPPTEQPGEEDTGEAETG